MCLSLDFFNATNIGVIINAIALVASAITVFFVWKQLKQNSQLERASFINSLNTELNQFVDVRVFLKSIENQNNITEIAIDKYERALDYFTAFENIRWMINLEVLSTSEAKDYFGARFYEAFESNFFQKNCRENKAFKLMYKMMFELHELFEKTPLTIGYAKPKSFQPKNKKYRKK